MRTFTHNVKSEGFEGTAVLERLTFSQHMRYIADCNFSQNGFNPENSYKSLVDNVDSITKMIELSKKHIKELNIKHIASGKCYNNFEDIEYDKDFYPVIMELATATIAGQQVGGA